MGYKYYDTPEGQDCFQKMLVTTKYAAIGGVLASTYDVLLYSHPKGYLQTIGRYAYLTGPLVAMAATFTATTCMATTLRHKDDKLNYFIGGALAGSVAGMWRKSFQTGFVSGIFLGTLAAIQKLSIEEKWDLLVPSKPPPVVQTSLIGLNHDYTMVKDRDISSWAK